MIPSYDKIHNRFKFNGHHYKQEDLKDVAYCLIKEGEPYEKTIGHFLLEWLSNAETITVKTSGSTGVPKLIEMKKQAMVHSAIATGDFFYLRPGDKALHCLPSEFIAGKMMLVRALILGLELYCVEPSSHPIFDYEIPYDFCAMVPIQLKHTINYTYNIKTIIVGGSKVTPYLLDRIAQSQSSCYETYGMTETATHVAVRQLASLKTTGATYFTALPNVNFSKDDRNCLVIDAKKLLDTPLVTNDIVALKSDNSFELLGRFDNVINSGGIKLFPEQIEAKLQNIIDERFIIASQKDDVLGQRVVLIVEEPRDSVDSIAKRIKYLKGISKYEIPKAIFTTTKFMTTETGKIQRSKIIKAVLG